MALILFVIGIGMAAVLVTILANVISDEQPTREDENYVEPEITNVVATGIDDGEVRNLRIIVAGGSEPVDANKTLVTITTNNGTQSLQTS